MPANSYYRQLLPLYVTDSPRPIVYPAGETALQLGEFSMLTDRMVYILTVQLNSADFILTISKGTSSAVRVPLAEVTSSGGVLTSSTMRSYVQKVESYLVGDRLTVFVRLAPSLNYAFSQEYFYMDVNSTGSFIEESLNANGYHGNFIEAIKKKAKEAPLTPCKVFDRNAAGPFDWGTMDRLVYRDWIEWGQENITFQYMIDAYPHKTFEELD